jgi:hypothetical protein
MHFASSETLMAAAKIDKTFAGCWWCRLEITERNLAVMFGFVRFEVFTAMTMKNDVFWGVAPCGSCKNRRFGGT